MRAKQSTVSWILTSILFIAQFLPSQTQATPNFNREFEEFFSYILNEHPDAKAWYEETIKNSSPDDLKYFKVQAFQALWKRYAYQYTAGLDDRSFEQYLPLINEAGGMESHPCYGFDIESSSTMYNLVNSSHLIQGVANFKIYESRAKRLKSFAKEELEKSLVKLEKFYRVKRETLSDPNIPAKDRCSAYKALRDEIKKSYPESHGAALRYYISTIYKSPSGDFPDLKDIKSCDAIDADCFTHHALKSSDLTLCDGATWGFECIKSYIYKNKDQSITICERLKPGNQNDCYGTFARTQKNPHACSKIGLMKDSGSNPIDYSRRDCCNAVNGDYTQRGDVTKLNAETRRACGILPDGTRITEIKADDEADTIRPPIKIRMRELMPDGKIINLPVKAITKITPYIKPARPSGVKYLYANLNMHDIADVMIPESKSEKGKIHWAPLHSDIPINKPLRMNFYEEGRLKEFSEPFSFENIRANQFIFAIRRGKEIEFTIASTEGRDEYRILPSLTNNCADLKSDHEDHMPNGPAALCVEAVMQSSLNAQGCSALPYSYHRNYCFWSFAQRAREPEACSFITDVQWKIGCFDNTPTR